MAKAKVVSKVVSTIVSTLEVERSAVELDLVTQNAINELVALRDKISLAEKEKKALDAQIKLALGDAEAGLINGVIRIKVSARTMPSVDTQLLKEAYPEAYEATKKETPYTVLMPQ